MQTGGTGVGVRTSQQPSGSHPQPSLGNPARSPEVLNLLVKLITLSLSLGLAPTALFISERYTSLCPTSEEAVYYHVVSLMRCGEHRQALEMLKSTLVDAPSPGSLGHTSRKPACEASIRCAYVYAHACEALDRPNEGGECLRRAYMILGSSRNKQGHAGDLSSLPHPNAASTSAVAIHLSLARLAAQAHKPDIACQRYMEALRAAWWCWEAYEGLCTMGRGLDAEEMLQQIPVPIVPDPPDDAALQQAASTNEVANNATRSVSSDRLSASQLPLLSPASTGNTVTPAAGHLPLKSSQTNGFMPFGKGQMQRNASTPIETQEAGFKFGEAGHLAEMNTNDLSAMGVGANLSFNDVSANESSNFFAAAPVRKGSFAAGGSGMFGFGRNTSDAGEGSIVGGGKKLFGTGLLFGNPAGGSSSNQSAAAASTSSTGGSFFTPVNQQRTGSAQPEAGPSSLIPNGLPVQQGRPPPAVKRNRNQVDVDDSMPSFQLNLRNHRGAGVSNGQRSRSTSATPLVQEDTDADMLGQAESYEQKVQIMGMNGHTEMQDDASARSEASSFSTSIIGRAPRKGSSTSAAAASRRSNRINGTSNSSLAPSDMVRKGSTSSNPAVKARTVSNPRDRKRSKAGPSATDDNTTTTTGSSIDSGGLSPHPYLPSSSPPSTTNSHFENLPPALAPLPATSAHLTSALSSSSNARPDRRSSTLPQNPSAQYRQALQNAQKALAENWLRSIFQSFIKATSALHRYDSPETVSAVLQLPPEQQKCSRAVLLLANAHFENLRYDEAEKAFSSARALSPYSPHGMEIYSTLLWHLHRPTQLSYLAQELQTLSHRLPHAWIATGNVFSHLEDHPNALKCFKRAIQTDPSFIYSYTLAGHECVTMEEWESATGFFREAIRRNPRHYNAWFGLGNVYMKTGKYRLAEYHFKRATDINGSNAMLVCCVGTVLEKLDRRKEALEMYERACLLAPASPAVRFKRVRMLMDLRQFDSALRDLMIVRELAPDEFNVHFLLGKLYGAMGDKANMTRSLTFAQDLEPRAAGRIREIIELGGQPPSGEEEEADEREDEEMSDQV